MTEGGEGIAAAKAGRRAVKASFMIEIAQGTINGILDGDEKQNLTARDHSLLILVQASFILDNIFLFHPDEMHTFRYHANSLTAHIARANQP